MEPKSDDGFGKIEIGIKNKNPPVFGIKMKNLSRESLAEMIAVTESIKLHLIEKYNKSKTSFTKNQ